MQKYDRYKHSGIEWIGEIPERWEVTRMKFVGSIRHGLSYKPADLRSADDGILVLRASNIQDGRLSFEDNVYVAREIVPDQKMVRTGDILICSTNGSLALVGKCALIEENIDAAFGSFMMVFHPKEEPRFIYYLLAQLVSNYRGLFATTTINQLTSSMLGDFCCILPPIQERKRISSYLDDKCRKIDNAIATQQKRIDLLKEQEQGIIACAVLKGLEPKAEMFDSGIDYIGQIPAHWAIMPIKYTAQGKGCCFIDGDWIESKDISSDGIKYLTTGNVGPNKYKEQGSGYITEEKFKELDCKDVYPGDLLISRLNEPIARTCIVPNLGTRIVTAVDNVIFRPNPRILDRKFAAYYLNNAKFTEHANIIARGATMHRISRTMLGHLKIALPPVEEQKQIVSYLEAQTAPIEAAISTAEKKVELLRSYKQSLVTEVVTGKRKVL